MIYGNDGTIHANEELDIEVDKETGEVVSVWFRCMALPFFVIKVGKDRAKDMKKMYENPMPTIQAVSVTVSKTIIVNGRPKEVYVNRVSFNDIMKLSDSAYHTVPRISYNDPTVWTRGVLNPGEEVDIESGYIFHVTETTPGCNK